MIQSLIDVSTPKVTQYIDRKELLKSVDEAKFFEEQQKKLASSTTVYVGNMSYYTTEEQIELLFGSVGTVRDIVMGLNRVDRTPCGFCFVEYETHDGACAAVNQLNLAILDDRRIRVDWDAAGNVRATGRFWARGVTGFQVQDEYRQNLDLARGGLGTMRATAEATSRSVLPTDLFMYEWIAPPAQKITFAQQQAARRRKQQQQQKPNSNLPGKRTRNF